MYASVDGCAFWLPSTLQQQLRKKVDKPFTLVQCKCRMVEYEHLFHHHPGADSACSHVRPEQNTLISVFKLNSCKLCQFKDLRARGLELAVRRSVRAFNRNAQTRGKRKLSEVLYLNG